MGDDQQLPRRAAAQPASDVSAARLPEGPLPGARAAVALLLAINLLNYIDRYILAAVEPRIRETFFAANDPHAMARTGLLATAFLVTYMVTAPIFGWLADRMSRWILIGISVLVWSLASGGSGLAPLFGVLLITRCFVGVGEAGYGPAAPTVIADLYPIRRRGSVLAWFYMAIPVGSALGYMLGGIMAAHWTWRSAFYVVVPPGIVLGIWSLFMRDPPRGLSDADKAHVVRTRARIDDYVQLLRIRSYVLDCAGMIAMTFAIGGMSFWMPTYLVYRHAGPLETVNLYFGALTVLAGVTATLLGGIAGDRMRPRFPGSYFLVSGVGILISCPLVVLVLITPFPYAWILVFWALFWLFFNTGPSNTILANVTHPAIRATAFAVNILVIHALGDAISPPILGAIAGPHDGIYHWDAAFALVVAMMALGGVLWLWGARYLSADTARAGTMLARAQGSDAARPPLAG